MHSPGEIQNPPVGAREKKHWQTNQLVL